MSSVLRASHNKRSCQTTINVLSREGRNEANFVVVVAVLVALGVSLLGVKERRPASGPKRRVKEAANAGRGHAFIQR